MSQRHLFTPLKVGHANLSHRLTLAPLTRFRADDQHVHFDIAKEYYEQRASTPGTLLITEATFISPRASGMDNVPGIWNAAQIAAWRSVTDAVHAKGCYIYCQLWALGRRAELAILAREEGGPYPVVSASDVPTQPGGHKPQPLTSDDIKIFINDYVTAARNAIEAGFDGVEIHGANGYLIDQFLSPDLNHRTDDYGGSIEKRSRFGLEVTRAVIDALGDSSKVAIRLSPWTDHGFPLDTSDRVPQFQHMIKELRELNIAYLHLVESRISGDVGTGVYDPSQTRNDPLIREWGTDQPIMLAGGFTPEKAAQIAEQYAHYQVLVAFGRYYISTPDLPFRIKQGLELTPYNRSTFYKKKSPEGYTDYPFHAQYISSIRAKA
jgi:NADPH2 dehydrogenase